VARRDGTDLVALSHLPQEVITVDDMIGDQVHDLEPSDSKVRLVNASLTM
jgi:hypothetical protein